MATITGNRTPDDVWRQFNEYCLLKNLPFPVWHDPDKMTWMKLAQRRVDDIREFVVETYRYWRLGTARSQGKGEIYSTDLFKPSTLGERLGDAGMPHPHPTILNHLQEDVAWICEQFAKVIREHPLGRNSRATTTLDDGVAARMIASHNAVVAGRK